MNISKKLLISVFSVVLMGCSSGKYHKVKKGDTLYSIAVKNKVSVTDIMVLNNLNTPHINTGTKLLLKGEAKNSKAKPNYHIIKPGETLYRLSVWYDISVERLRQYNNLPDNTIYVGQKIYLNSKYSKNNTQIYKSASKSSYISPTLKSFRWPIKTKEITSKFGSRIHPITGRKTTHDGVDLKSKMNTPVYAPYSGTVTYSGWMRGYGKVVIINHGNGYETRYAHLNRWLVKKGQKISKGQVIAKTGNTGLSTGPHLHYEIRKNSKPVDPTITI
ncbi:M23 family metallopeptidase [Ilyobacter polytropus]|uniref:Peptidase M23 n=1 Tax=Ilyobacter polytropus (strain ATCC 51220 / DSM 2926 / LMG 16218 / CuHBu1) TaxID=572544 RepID=E3H8F0_ILYPC|nr:M23 family metallopeptidase [Ilyobacter polytropus]ADO82717.1 Peptidase M23 [Ilyobacter polytropus DSM 2926]